MRKTIKRKTKKKSKITQYVENYVHCSVCGHKFPSSAIVNGMGGMCTSCFEK